ncbi:sigma-54-dependent transcriptional regulator [Rubeoparvulum massiliense]|uniref:sigma-54-dependent transcriptional regulator n=1 Tax=Rubeoparvulum massiliense TaxID=1631346 RepID=UPI001E4E552B|nr:sigma-54 dependent transcriptional regulator [Rubeoparvulum massiliense]
MKVWMQVPILIVDDEEEFRTMLAQRLQRKNYQCFTAANGVEALALLAEREFAVVLSDIRMPQMDGLTLLEEVEKLKSGTQVIMITGHGTIETAIEAMKKGAYDYVTKPIQVQELEVLLSKAAEKYHLYRENLHLKAVLRERQPDTSLIAVSPQMKSLLVKAERVAITNSPVLITGESGTGKELIAQYIYQHSNREAQPFMPINMGALPEQLLESELFGHVKGAFTGASQEKHGLVEIVDQGTLLLDEIGDMPYALQVKLLRFLESGEFRPVGGTRIKKVDVRVIAATNANLEDKIAAGQFRADLYYRLNVIELRIPPLRERREDILPLSNYFLQKKSIQFQEEKELSKEAEQALLHYDFPGNVRELSHMIERGIILCPGRFIETEHLGFPQASELFSKTLTPLKEMERQHILEVLNFCHWNKTKAAALLEISVRNLYRKIEEYGLEPKDLSRSSF